MKYTIRRILKEEINKKFPKPNEKIDKSIYNWLTLYFKNTEIYKEEYWKYHGFRYSFCKNGREIADLRVVFGDNSPDWGPRDKRPTSERSVKEIMLYIYPSLVDMMRDIFPVRKNYLIYLIEEWFEDTKLYEIQQELGPGYQWSVQAGRFKRIPEFARRTRDTPSQSYQGDKGAYKNLRTREIPRTVNLIYSVVERDKAQAERAQAEQRQ